MEKSLSKPKIYIYIYYIDIDTHIWYNMIINIIGCVVSCKQCSCVWMCLLSLLYITMTKDEAESLMRKYLYWFVYEAHLFYRASLLNMTLSDRDRKCDFCSFWYQAIYLWSCILVAILLKIDVQWFLYVKTRRI